MTTEEADRLMAGHRVLRIRFGIITRCRNKNSATYREYGAKGVDICEGWFSDPRKFLMDLGLPPTDKHSVDRIDNGAGYTCGTCSECVRNRRRMNCRWSTPKEQANNTRSTRFLTCFGFTRSISDWSDCTGIEHGTLLRRIYSGEPAHSALTRQVKPPVNIKDNAAKHGLTPSAYLHRISRGKPLDKPMQKRKKNVTGTLL